MSKITNGRLGQYGAEPFEQQQFGTVSIEGVKGLTNIQRLRNQTTFRGCGPVILS